MSSRISRSIIFRLLASGALVRLAGVAQPVPADAPEPRVAIEAVVVSGLRASLASAQEVKREKQEIVDVVVAEDIGKLPDFNVTEALQRVTGIQILRDRGEGSGVAIRGLTQLQATLNGREIFTAGMGRTLDFADLPAELLAEVDVYKSASADQLEGGIGGLIDLRTRRPFDFTGRRIAASARLIHGHLVDRAEPQVSLLYSDRGRVGRGEFGALVSVVAQERAWREDTKSTGAPLARTDLVPGQTVIAPSGTTETTSLGRRDRRAASVVLQWRPTDRLELYAEGNYAEFKTIQDSHQINVFPSSSPVAGSVSLFPGTNDVRTVAYANAPFSVLSFARDTVDRTRQAAAGAIWTGEELRVRADASYTRSFNDLYFSGPFFAGTAAVFSQDLTGSLPATAVSGTDLTNPQNFRYTGAAYRARPFHGDLGTVTADAERAFRGGFLQSVSAGVRYARRGADNLPGLVFGDAPVAGLTAADTPALVSPNPFTDFFAGRGAASVGEYVIGNLDSARDPLALRDALGVTAPLPAAANPLSLWEIDETTTAFHVLARFRGSRLPIEGNVGIRAVHTKEATSGHQSVPGVGVEPLAIADTYTDLLPSLNARYALSDGLRLRFAASKTLTRPDFIQLSPSLILVPNPINPAANIGNAGNPALRPVRADNFDLSLERTFNATSSVYVAAFHKRVDGFIANESRSEQHQGATYQVTRPYNSAAAEISGWETGYQQFFDFLPGRWRGLGVQANYTRVESSTPSSILGMDVPLQNLSKNSCNLIGLYEGRRVSGRVAYNWRDTFLSGTTTIAGVGAFPIYTRAYGWLDASLSFRMNEHLTLELAGMNLLNTMRRSYHGVETRPQSAWMNDRQVAATMRMQF